MFIPVPVPISYNVRIRSAIPIVEIKAECPADISVWIDDPLKMVEKGIKAGGRLLPKEPKEVMKPNAVFFAMIFENMQKVVEFAESLRKG